MNRTFFIFWVLLIVAKNIEADSTSETELKKRILVNTYDKLIRPAEKVNINIGILIKQLVGVDEKSQIIITSTYLIAAWMDERLKWNNSEFGTSKLSIKANLLWLPDLYVINTADSNGFITSSDSNQALLRSDGSVQVNFGLNGLRTRCTMNVYKFPFDKQSCSIMIGSWFQYNEWITFSITTNHDPFSEDFVKNPVWQIIDYKLKIVENSSRITSEYKTNDFYFEFKIKRGPLYYMINNVYPCLILNVVTLLTYFLPFALQATLTLTTFLNMAIISVRVASDIPVQSDYLPLISLYFLLGILYTFVSFIWFLISNVYKTNNYLPKHLKYFAQVLKLFHQRILMIRTIKTEVAVQENIAEIDGFIIYLNYFAFGVLSLTMFISYLAIWLSISY